METADIRLSAGGHHGVGVEAAVGPHRELSPGPAVAHPPHRLNAGSGRRRERCWRGPRAAGPSARRRCQRPRPTAGDSPAGRCSCGGGRLPWPAHRLSQMVESRSMVRGVSPGPAPAAQARASNSRLTRSSWRTCPHRKLRRKVPRVDGALTVPPRKCGRSRRCATRRRRQCSHRQPAQTQPAVMILAGVRPARGIAQVQARPVPVGASPGAGPRWWEGSARHWLPDGGRPKVIWMRSGWSSGSMLLSAPSFRVGFVIPKPLSPKAQELLVGTVLQHAADSSSFRWIGVYR